MICIWKYRQISIHQMKCISLTSQKNAWKSGHFIHVTVPQPLRMGGCADIDTRWRNIPSHSPPHHPTVKPLPLFLLSTLTKHTLAWGHCATVPTFSLWKLWLACCQLVHWQKHTFWWTVFSHSKSSYRHGRTLSTSAQKPRNSCTQTSWWTQRIDCNHMKQFPIFCEGTNASVFCFWSDDGTDRESPDNVSETNTLPYLSFNLSIHWMCNTEWKRRVLPGCA